ncbi:MAG TPA: lipopolysaccharide kinase InaA family protein [Thermodesulfobacteriota bacterium]|nr:hypothetical protein [Deltaproteobacteria bacterium]HOC39370.1 lipopolysaccharide kinase InaA family protein [Thermodesulfobacteriota bacterium]
MESLREHAWKYASWDGMNWVIAHDCEPSILARIWTNAKEPERHSDCRVIQKNILRTSILANLLDHTDGSVFLKRHHRRHWRDDVRSLLVPSRAFNEWKTLLHFQRLGLPAPVPIAYGEQRCHGIVKDSCLITKALPDVQPIVPALGLELASLTPRQRFLFRRELIDQLAYLVARLHNAGVYYRDLHGGNILYRKTAGKPLELFFVDTDKAWFFSKLSHKKRIADLATLYNSVFGGSLSMWTRFLINYLRTSENFSPSWRILFTNVKPVAESYQKRHGISRRKRCLKESTTFGVATKKGTKLYFRKDVTRSALEAALEYIEEQSNQGDSCCSQKRFSITIVPSQVPGSMWCASGYRYSFTEKLRSLFGHSAAKQAWITANTLVERNIPTMKPLALAERRKFFMVTTSCLIALNPDGTESLLQYVLSRFSQDRAGAACTRFHCLLRAFASSLSELYRKEVFLPSLTAETIRVYEAGSAWCFLFPYDSMAVIDQPVGAENMVHNLLSIHRSLPPGIGSSARTRFVYQVLRSRPSKERDNVAKQLQCCATSLPEKEFP